MDSADNASSFTLEKLQRMSISQGPLAFVNKDISKYFDPPSIEDPDSWMIKPEIPSSDEILGTDDDYIDLVPNKIHGPWESKDAYLKAHYELIREDAVASLRDAVAIVRNDPAMCDNKSVSIYEKVYVTGLTFTRRGLAFRIQFSTHRAGKNIAWDYSKRLVSGSMVALSPASDAFQTKCAVAIVAARPLEGVKQQPPEVDIYFANPEDADFDPQLEWIMVEAKDGYYEAARHTMTALQKLSQERFPLADHICFLNPKVRVPEYVENDPIFQVHSAIHDSDDEGKLNILSDWPQSPIGDLDATQWTALEKMLTRQLAIIQGPPGTGKTFISVIALRILLSNMAPGDPPIIIASQTNHALDQLLSHVSRFERKYVRLGARSGDPEIKKRTLYAIRHSEPTPTIHGSHMTSANRSMKALSSAVSEVLQPFNAANSDEPLPSSAFKKYNLLTEKQWDSLEKGAKGWVSAGKQGEEIDPLIVWLGDQTCKFEVTYTMENFGFAEDEVDLEYEQLKELEAEQGLEDDDYENLRGSFAHLREGFYGRQDSETAGSEYLHYADMWKIPVKERGGVYNHLRNQLKARVLQEFRALLAQYTANCKTLQIAGWERDFLILQNTRLIGMTATGLSKYRALISCLRPRVVLIEEAAEAIEAPIAAACFDSLQQMILVGDHQQLRGQCAVQDLAGEPFHLDVSMFERLVKNGLSYVTLQRQRRMVPEIRQLLIPIYGVLQDHESVRLREEVPGMGKVRAFFFSHDWPESFDSLASKYNEKEAEMIVGLFLYLVLNDVAVKDITILTFYNGQRKRLLKSLKNHPYLQGHYVKVVTVDSYQGEENEVVILSLVRNGKDSIGFLSIANRVCVALSRARRGFYMFGNAELLASADPLWAQVLHIMGNKLEQPRIGYSLPLTCAKHGNKTYIKSPADWSELNGGCQRPCGERLPHCGHKCSIRCHSFSHDRVQCTELCNKRMVCKHVCKVACATSHTCSCNCEESQRLESLTQDAFGTENMLAKASLAVGHKNERQTAIDAYHAFANGASKVHDAVLDQMAGSAHQRNWPTAPSFGDDLVDANAGVVQLQRSLLDD